MLAPQLKELAAWLPADQFLLALAFCRQTPSTADWAVVHFACHLPPVNSKDVPSSAQMLVSKYRLRLLLVVSS